MASPWRSLRVVVAGILLSAGFSAGWSGGPAGVRAFSGPTAPAADRPSPAVRVAPVPAACAPAAAVASRSICTPTLRTPGRRVSAALPVELDGLRRGSRGARRDRFASAHRGAGGADVARPGPDWRSRVGIIRPHAQHRPEGLPGGLPLAATVVRVAQVVERIRALGRSPPAAGRRRSGAPPRILGLAPGGRARPHLPAVTAGLRHTGLRTGVMLLLPGLPCRGLVGPRGGRRQRRQQYQTASSNQRTTRRGRETPSTAPARAPGTRHRARATRSRPAARRVAGQRGDAALMQGRPVGIAIAHCREAPAAGLRPLRIDRRGHAAQHLHALVLGETAVRGAAPARPPRCRRPSTNSGSRASRRASTAIGVCVVDAVGLGVGQQQDGLGLRPGAASSCVRARSSAAARFVPCASIRRGSILVERACDNSGSSVGGSSTPASPA
jgi:hypothetical protein